MEVGVQYNFSINSISTKTNIHIAYFRIVIPCQKLTLIRGNSVVISNEFYGIEAFCHVSGNWYGKSALHVEKSERKGILKNKRITGMSLCGLFTNTYGFPGLLATFIWKTHLKLFKSPSILQRNPLQIFREIANLCSIPDHPIPSIHPSIHPSVTWKWPEGLGTRRCWWKGHITTYQ